MTLKNLDNLKIHLTPMFFENYVAPNGFLSRDMAAHACFYYFMLCEKARETVGNSIDDQRVYEGDEWMFTHYENQRKAVMILYDLPSMESIDPHWPAVRMQATLLGLPEPKEEYVKSKRYN